RLPAHDLGDLLGDLAIVHGIGDVVRGGRHVQRQLQDHIDDEVLPLFALEVVHAVVPPGADAAQHDAIYEVHDLPSCQASSTASASRVAATSCTRTPHTPALAAKALVTAVARSRRSGVA